MGAGLMKVSEKPFSVQGAKTRAADRSVRPTWSTSLYRVPLLAECARNGHLLCSIHGTEYFFQPNLNGFPEVKQMALEKMISASNDYKLFRIRNRFDQLI